jgi:hypothetical protein
VESLSAGVWTATVLPPPSGETYADLNAVTCLSSGSCQAVGSYYPSFGGPGYALVESLSAGSWTSTTGLDGAKNSRLDSVACATSGSSCVTLGSDLSTSPAGLLALVLGAGSWTPATESLPTGADGGALTAASCLVSCTGVGWDEQIWSVLPGYQAAYPVVATFS